MNDRSTALYLYAIPYGLLLAALGCFLAAACLTGCATKPTSNYPYPKFLDPVTEQVPNVIR